jgi:hypothetical protein
LQLHAAAIGAAKVRPETIANAEAAHGMEQQLIEGLVECLSAGPAYEEAPAKHRHQEPGTRRNPIDKAHRSAYAHDANPSAVDAPGATASGAAFPGTAARPRAQLLTWRGVMPARAHPRSATEFTSIPETARAIVRRPIRDNPA